MDTLRVLGIWEVLLQGMRGAGGHWLAHVGSLLQPSLDPLPPYILAEARLRSQRYQRPLCSGSPGGPWGGAPAGPLPTQLLPQGLHRAADPGVPG